MPAAKGKKIYQPVTHCIFDNDGTLLDTEKQYSDAIRNILKEYNRKYTYDLEMQCLGLPTKVACELLIDKLDLPVGRWELNSKFEDEVYRLIGHVQLKPGAQQLLLHLHEHRIPMAVVTSSNQKYFNLKATPHYRLLPAFRHIVCCDDPELIHGKPAPDIFLLAASRFKPAPSPGTCLVFEDSVMGVKAARAAGMQVVMTPDPRVPIASRRNATMVIKSLADFQPELFGLPPYEYVPKFTFGRQGRQVIKMPAEECFLTVSHVIFDFDGTLVDTEKLYTKAAQNVLNSYGYKLTPELKQRVVGRPSNMLARTVIEEFSLQVDEDEFVARYDSEAHGLLDNVPLMPGAERLLVHLHNERIPMAIATSSYKDSFQHKAQAHCDILSVIHHVVCGNDSELVNGKPAPDIYLLAASRFPRPVQPHCCLVFEDSPAGMEAGRAAGMQVVMTPDPLVSPELLVGATQVLPSLECFQPEQFGLPPYDYKEQFTFG